jgi:hypothetical protein
MSASFFTCSLWNLFVTYLHYFLGSMATTIFMWALSLSNKWMDELCICVWASRSWHKKFTFNQMNWLKICEQIIHSHVKYVHRIHTSSNVTLDSTLLEDNVFKMKSFIQNFQCTLYIYINIFIYYGFNETHMMH